MRSYGNDLLCYVMLSERRIVCPRKSRVSSLSNTKLPSLCHGATSFCGSRCRFASTFSPHRVLVSSHLFVLYRRYDAEESGTVVDGEDAADVFVGDDKLFAAREAALAKRSGGAGQARLVRADGSKMSLAASKKYSALHADNQQWEDRQLMASGVVRRGEQDLDIDDEEENKAILLVHDTKPPFLDGRVVFTKQAEPVMPLKDPTSDMAIIARKGSALMREVSAGGPAYSPRLKA